LFENRLVLTTLFVTVHYRNPGIFTKASVYLFCAGLMMDVKRKVVVLTQRWQSLIPQGKAAS